MCAKMTRARAEEFGAAWNSGNADLVATSLKTVSIMRRSDPTHLARPILVRTMSVVVFRLFRPLSRREIRKSESGCNRRHWDL
jgi:hypothetical protein